jgi:iron complex transport system permease protein
MTGSPSSDRPLLGRLLVAVAASAVFFALATVCSILFGAEHVSLARALSDSHSLDRTIILRARLPRIALAAVAGGGLSVVGAALQLMLRNPLAEPYLLGVSGGAALGATVAILTGLTALAWLGAALVPLVALVGGLGATAIVYAVARSDGGPSRTGILLAGIIVNAIASSLITFAKSIVSPSKAQELLFWLIGFVDVPHTAELVAVSGYVIVGFGLLLSDAGRLNVLALGEEAAAHLGIDVQRIVKRIFFASSLIVGAIVSVTGLIGFIGLVVPHIARRIVGPDMRVLMPVCLFGGGAALVLSDLVARASFVWIAREPPVGAITALLGGPIALAMIRTQMTRSDD